MTSTEILVTRSRRGDRPKPPADQQERFLAEELHRGRREEHTQRKFAREAMRVAVRPGGGIEPQMREAERRGAGRIHVRSPSTYRFNKSNVKRKPAAR